jgi:imidazolonepropionase-like amidohydrolase
MNRPATRRAIALACLAAVAIAAPGAWAADAPVRALHGQRLYVSPDDKPLEGGVVRLREGVVVSAGAGGASDDAPSLDSRCDGGVIVAGFQNSHVHLIGPGFIDARHRPAAQLQQALDELLTRWGFTTAFDIASDRDNTLALRERVDKGEIIGPRLLTVGLPLFPPDGLPFYLRDADPAFIAKMPQPATVAQALKTVRENLDAGTDGTKLFLVTPQGHGKLKQMPADIAAAAVEETHRRGKLVFAHPTNLDGIRAALQAHVDILAHPPLGIPAPWPAPLMAQVRDSGTAMIPTLKLLPYELAKEHVPAAEAQRIVNETVQEFGRFVAAGGQVLFGTDVDYMTDTDPTQEYELMGQAGMSAMQILASLTTTPAARWNESARRGRIAPGMAADLVVLDADPAQDVRRFAAVRCVVRGGQVIYPRQVK